jgi:hypothetical protein
MARYASARRGDQREHGEEARRDAAQRERSRKTGGRRHSGPC